MNRKTHKKPQRILTIPNQNNLSNNGFITSHSNNSNNVQFQNSPFEKKKITAKRRGNQMKIDSTNIINATNASPFVTIDSQQTSPFFIVNDNSSSLASSSSTPNLLPSSSTFTNSNSPIFPNTSTTFLNTSSTIPSSLSNQPSPPPLTVPNFSNNNNNEHYQTINRITNNVAEFSLQPTRKKQQQTRTRLKAKRTLKNTCQQYTLLNNLKQKEKIFISLFENILENRKHFENSLKLSEIHSYLKKEIEFILHFDKLSIPNKELFFNNLQKVDEELNNLKQIENELQNFINNNNVNKNDYFVNIITKRNDLRKYLFIELQKVTKEIEKFLSEFNQEEEINKIYKLKEIEIEMDDNTKRKGMLSNNIQFIEDSIHRLIEDENNEEEEEISPRSSSNEEKEEENKEEGENNLGYLFGNKDINSGINIVLQNLLQYQFQITNTGQVMSKHFQKTNQAFHNFYLTLQEEYNEWNNVNNNNISNIDNNEKHYYTLTKIVNELKIELYNRVKKLNYQFEFKNQIQSLFNFYKEKENELNSFIEMSNLINNEDNNINYIKDKTIEDIYQFYKNLQQELREIKRNQLKINYKKEEMELEGSSIELLNNLQNTLQQLNNELNQKQKKLQNFEQQLQKCKISHPEIPFLLIHLENQNIESIFKNQKIPMTIFDFLNKNSLQVTRSLKDYEILRKINDKILIVKFADKISILKKFSFLENRKKFIQEIDSLSKLNHPCIVKIENFFIENENTIYIQMEYLGEVTLKDYLQQQQHDIINYFLELKSVFHSLCQVIHFIHQNNIIHCDLKPENIMMVKKGNNCWKPILIDFEISKNLKRSLTLDSIQVKGTLPYLPPEVLQSINQTTINNNTELLNQYYSYSLDVWSLGVLMYQSFFCSEVVLLPNEEYVKTTTSIYPFIKNYLNNITNEQLSEYQNILQNNMEYLSDLLKNILQRDPKKRFTMDDIITHIFFTTSGIDLTKVSSSILNNKFTDSKIQTFQRFLYHYKNTSLLVTNRNIFIKLKRNNIVRHVFEAFRQLNSQHLLNTLKIEFNNEIGYDLGGLTTNMYNEFFKNVIEEKYGLFECDNLGNVNYLPIRDNFNGRNEFLEKYCNRYFHSTMNEENINFIFYLIGKILMKCLFDQRIIPNVFSPFLFKILTYFEDDQYFENINVTFRDLELFDSQLAHSLSLMVTTNDIDLFELNFNEFNERDDRKVTNNNKEEYIKKKIRYILLDSRLGRWQQLRKGFQEAIPELLIPLKTFYYRELMVLFYGLENDFLDVETIIELLDFKGFNNYSTFPHLFKEVLRKFDVVTLRKFLEFTTGQPSLPYNTDRKPIIIQRVMLGSNALPVSHVCSSTIDIPEYRNLEQLEEKLVKALDYSSMDGFHLA
ncbi:hypothetical protein ABK040_006724 [Willaertia magna]